MVYTGEQKREYQRKWVAARRAEWIKEHGPCIDCGTWANLEVDHKDPAAKEFEPGQLWSWSKERRDKELSKCVVRCEECHRKKTTAERKAADVWSVLRILEPEGMAWCRGHKAFEPVNMFGKRANRSKNGLREYCKPYRNELLKGGKQV